MARIDQVKRLIDMPEELKAAYWHLGILNSSLAADYIAPSDTPNKTAGLLLLSDLIQQNSNNLLFKAILCYVQEIMHHKTRDIRNRVEISFDGVDLSLIERISLMANAARQSTDILLLVAQLNAKDSRYKVFSYMNILKNHERILAHCETILNKVLDPEVGENNQIAFETMILYCNIMQEYQEAETIDDEVKKQRLNKFKQYLNSHLHQPSYRKNACLIMLALQVMWYQLPQSERMEQGRVDCIVNGKIIRLEEFFGIEETPILDNLFIFADPAKVRTDVLKKLKTAAPHYHELINTVANLLGLPLPPSFTEEIKSTLTDFFNNDHNVTSQNDVLTPGYYGPS